MREYKVLSEYFSDDTVKSAQVVSELGTNRFIVRMMNDAGSYFTASYVDQDEAEACAEDWVTK